jgi:polysaccharide deacetylase 2 family uncharacterized protein YibQ
MAGVPRTTAIVLVALSVLCRAAGADPQPRIAIIIDDLGYERTAGERAIALPGPISFAVLPGAPYSSRLADLANAHGKEVLLHLPLQATVDAQEPVPGSLVIDMSETEFRTAIGTSIASVPHVIGINTHRGSLLTRHPGHMRWLMDEIQAHGDLFFVDSYTTAQSVALRIARENGVPAVRRHVFLDPDADSASVAREFNRLRQKASEQGFAVGIGHPYPATLDFLEQALPALDGVDLVPVSALVRSIPAGSR